jgi:hypothetical protein
MASPEASSRYSIYQLSIHHPRKTLSYRFSFQLSHSTRKKFRLIITMGPADDGASESKSNANGDPKPNALEVVQDAAINAPVKAPATTKPKAKQLPIRPGFQLVKLRMPDGTIKRAWRPIADEKSVPISTQNGSENLQDAEKLKESNPSPTKRQTESQSSTSSEGKPPAYTEVVESKQIVPSPPTTSAISAPPQETEQVPEEIEVAMKPSEKTTQKSSNTTTARSAPVEGTDSSKTRSEVKCTKKSEAVQHPAAPAKAPEITIDDSEAAPSAARNRLRAAVTRSAFGFLTQYGISKAVEALAPGSDVGDTYEQQDGDDFVSDDEWPSDTSDDDGDGGYDGGADDDQQRDISEDDGDRSGQTPESIGLMNGYSTEKAHQGKVSTLRKTRVDAYWARSFTTRKTTSP